MWRPCSEGALRRFGQIDCLVNNAGMRAPVTPLADLNIADFDESWV
jgi:NAD(P)-dependent dehydrogenase (short-subunit alcohol dehydrogenase family)